ncbi:MAG: CoA transferase [Candidatus Dormibacteria bacterium]
MTGSGATLLVAAAGLFGIALFTLSHRRDALGATLAVVLGFDAVACALVGFAALAAQPAAAAQLQAFAIVVEVVGALFAAAGVSLSALLRRRTGGRDLLDLALAGAAASASPEPMEDHDDLLSEEPPESEPDPAEPEPEPAAEEG